MKPTTAEQVNLPPGAPLNGESTASPPRTQRKGRVGAGKNDRTDKQRKKNQTEGNKHQSQFIPAAMTKLCPVRLRGVGNLSPKKSPRRVGGNGNGQHRPSMTPLFPSPTKKRDGYKSVESKDTDDDGKVDPAPTTPVREGHPSSSTTAAAEAGGGRMLPSRGAVSPSGTCTSSSSEEGAADDFGTTGVRWQAPPRSSQQQPPPSSSSSPRERALAGFCRDATTAEDLEDPILMMQSVTTTMTAPSDLGDGSGRGGEAGEDAAHTIPNDTEKKGHTVELELDCDEEEDDEKEDPEEVDPEQEEADKDGTSSRRRRRRRRRRRGVEDDDDNDDDPPLSGKLLVFQRLRSDDDEDDVDIEGGENDDDDPLTISPQMPVPAPLPAPSALRVTPSVAGEGGGADGVGEAVSGANGDVPPPPSPTPSKGVTFAHDNPTLSLTSAGNKNDCTRRTHEFAVNESDQRKSLPELLQTISVLRDRLSRASVDVSGEKALRRRKEKNLIKLARELNMMADTLREKDAQIKKLLADQATLEEKVSTLGEQLENATQLSHMKSRDHHNEITLYQTKLRSCRRDFEEAASSRARQAEELRGRLLATSLECDRLRVTCAKMEMMRQTTATSAHRDNVRGTVLDAKIMQRSPGNDESRRWRVRLFGEANCLARVTGAVSRALLFMACSMLVLLLLFVVGCIAVMSQGSALSFPLTRNVLCAPAPPGTVLEASVSTSPKSITYDAPWWAPPMFKERAYDALCDEDGDKSSKSDDRSTPPRPRRRQRCRMEWLSEGGAGKGTLTTTTLDDGRVLNRVTGISRARVGPFGALVPAQRCRRIFRRGCVDGEVFLPGPWAL